MVARTPGLLLLLTLSACTQEGIDARAELPGADEHYFRCQVQPVLARSCAFMDCHGNDERPLRIYAEQRFRLDVDWLEFETPLTGAELAANLKTVRGFIGPDEDHQALLSEKPLDARYGGMFHRGKDLYGTDDVFLDRQEPGYQVLRSFVEGESAAPDCQPATGASR